MLLARAKIAAWLSSAISTVAVERRWLQRRCKPSRIPISSPLKMVCVSICPRLNVMDLMESPDMMAATTAM